MKIEELKMIPIKDLLSHMGIDPVMSRCCGEQLMYISPLRPDRNASFSVNTRKNLWMDFGTQLGGNVIDLVIALKGDCTFSEAVAWLEEQVGALDKRMTYDDIDRFLQDQASKKPDNSYLSNVQVEVLANPVLFRYLESRGIPAEIGWRYCKEAHYTVRDRKYFAIAFMNILGGMELRSRNFKGCHGVKALSIDRVNKSERTPTCCVFEGFMDFLSYKTRERMGDKVIPQPFPCDCIVLNSTSMVRQAAPFIGVYSKAFCYLDCDDAGWKALEKLEELLPGKVICCADRYRMYLYGKDLNDYHKEHLDRDAWREIEGAYQTSFRSSFHPAKPEFLPDEMDLQ